MTIRHMQHDSNVRQVLIGSVVLGLMWVSGNLYVGVASDEQQTVVTAKTEHECIEQLRAAVSLF